MPTELDTAITLKTAASAQRCGGMRVCIAGGNSAGALTGVGAPGLVRAAKGRAAMGTEQYGGYYWCAKTTLSEDGEIYVMADDARVLPDGTLAFIRHSAGERPEQVNLALAPGQWMAVFAASMIDGAAVAVERWAGEVSPRSTTPKREHGTA